MGTGGLDLVVASKAVAKRRGNHFLVKVYSLEFRGVGEGEN